MHHPRHRLAAAGLALGLATAPLAGQDQAVDPRFWFGIGVGSGWGSVQGGSLYGALSFQTGRHLIKLRSAVVFEIPGDADADLGVLYGIATRRASTHASVALGIGFASVAGSLCGGPFERWRCVSLPLEAAVSYRPFGGLGLGLTAWADINRDRTFGGIVLTLEVGRVR
jgi:hypothetical protein